MNFERGKSVIDSTNNWKIELGIKKEWKFEFPSDEFFWNL